MKAKDLMDVLTAAWVQAERYSEVERVLDLLRGALQPVVDAEEQIETDADAAFEAASGSHDDR